MSKIEPLELKQSILREIDNCIIAVGSNRRIFPYSALEVRLLAHDQAAQGLLKSAFIDNNILETAILSHLRPPRCEQAEPRVKIVLTEAVEESQITKGFEIKYISKTTNLKDAEAYLEVLEGIANRKQIHLRYRETFIGRCELPSAKGSKVIRKNDLYFLDPRENSGRMSKELKASEKINQSVSRMHAHISYNEKYDSYHIYDDGSSKGTTLLRGGRGVAINIDRHIGKALENGDVLCFGKARVKFKLVKKGDLDAESEASD